MPENLGLTLSEESLKRLVPTKFARGAFLRQQPLGPVQTQALAEGTLRAAAAVKSQRLAQVQRIQVEKERIALEKRRFTESKRQFAAAAAERRRERKRAEPSFIETLFGK
jgi:hypothetical protein